MDIEEIRAGEFRQLLGNERLLEAFNEYQLACFTEFCDLQPSSDRAPDIIMKMKFLDEFRELLRDKARYIGKKPVSSV